MRTEQCVLIGKSVGSRVGVRLRWVLFEYRFGAAFG